MGAFPAVAEVKPVVLTPAGGSGSPEAQVAGPVVEAKTAPELAEEERRAPEPGSSSEMAEVVERWAVSACRGLLGMAEESWDRRVRMGLNRSSTRAEAERYWKEAMSKEVD